MDCSAIVLNKMLEERNLDTWSGSPNASTRRGMENSGGATGCRDATSPTTADTTAAPRTPTGSGIWVSAYAIEASFIRTDPAPASHG